MKPQEGKFARSMGEEPGGRRHSKGPTPPGACAESRKGKGPASLVAVGPSSSALHYLSEASKEGT